MVNLRAIANLQVSQNPDHHHPKLKQSALLEHKAARRTLTHWPAFYIKFHPETSCDRYLVSPGMALSPERNSTKPPATPPRSSARGVHARHSSLSKSPVNLPIRPELDVAALRRSQQSHAENPQLHSHTVSPRRSFYLEKSLPVLGDQVLVSPRHSIEPPVPETMREIGLIFDDGDERLPPPEVSPSRRYNSEADIVAVSSPFGAGSASRIAQAEVDVFDYSLASEDDAGEYIPGNLSYENNGQLSPILPSDSISVAGLSHTGHLSPAFAASYPTRLPPVLMRPPILSKKGAHNHRRQQSLDALTSIEPPQWTASPLENEIQVMSLTELPDQMHLTGLNSFFSQDEYAVSDVDSDRATIMSGDEDEFREAPLKGPMDEVDKEVEARDGKGRSWVSKLFFKKDYTSLGESKDEMGETYDGKEADQVNSQMALPNPEAAFTRLDPETIQRHSQMFNAGGLHNAITPRSGGPTSLIEELEIRKAGKKVQQDVFFREINEIERQRAEDSNKHIHPADVVHNVQPTLLQMQHMAASDYQVRVQWHKRAINKNYIQENGSETLAQRRARLRASKIDQGKEGQIQETLAQRRQRLKDLRKRQAGEATSGDRNMGNELFAVGEVENSPADTIRPAINSVSEVC